MSSADWERTVSELKRRGNIKKKLRVVEGYKQTVPTEAKDPREFLQEPQQRIDGTEVVF
ncbi:hypothetical protein HBI56_011480 [Parastagonospora nodorum]|uniref:Uncharacterized protein n=1 Tax=Phaeosphaeria nodorum (strain SN15 / ATCC MYA-4574 / FGSC 10173) TaxID=321614 RepID=A0A7U2EPQ4_PHANO|nr:hypothetical protein HBH56_010270 [Parastagonospora nodorum]QRC90714.1 hypothetical protein JI435_425900 [Parastagonospora nodorum SN15]KAH3934963.1 hypothetical protein HBH54_043570 [Parastagonospora nodorum]KAH3943575.1 hypothetical protein HBH53_170300 [Parastagonospora nodorum]KAH3986695.1 hypothetical protein HBH51_013210 [Parastagonospora nodorum]